MLLQFAVDDTHTASDLPTETEPGDDPTVTDIP
jgi:hypothetical protein